MFGARKSLMRKYASIDPVAALVPVVQSSFPTLGTSAATKIAQSVNAITSSTVFSGAQIIGLLARPGTDVWDLKYRFSQYQDAAGTSAIVADGDPVRHVKPWKGTNNLVADTGFGFLNANEALGAEFPDGIAVMRFTRRTGITFTAFSVTQKSPSPSPFPFGFLMGDDNTSPFHPVVDTTTALFDLTWSEVRDGSIWINNVLTSNTSQTMTTSPMVVSTQPTTAIAVSSISRDRNFLRYYFGRGSLYLVSNETYTAAEINAINRFVMNYTGVS